MNNRRTQENFFKNICTSNFIVRVRNGLLKVCVWEAAGHRTETAIFWPHSYGRHVVSFLFSWCSTGAPEAHSAGWWLPLLHLISNFSGPLTPSGFPRAGCGFPYYNSSFSDWNPISTAWLPSWLSYIIIQRPHDRPLDLWNRMFNRHQAEITVMQFTSHSLPVRQSMSVPWEFFTSSHFISQFPPTRFPLITAIRMCLPSGASPWNGFFGRVKRSKYNNLQEISQKI